MTDEKREETKFDIAVRTEGRTVLLEINQMEGHRTISAQIDFEPDEAEQLARGLMDAAKAARGAKVGSG